VHCLCRKRLFPFHLVILLIGPGTGLVPEFVLDSIMTQVYVVVPFVYIFFYFVETPSRFIVKILYFFSSVQ
jgi:hypothetical protein